MHVEYEKSPKPHDNFFFISFTTYFYFFSVDNYLFFVFLLLYSKQEAHRKVVLYTVQEKNISCNSVQNEKRKQGVWIVFFHKLEVRQKEH